MVVDADGNQVGDAMYDGCKAAQKVSWQLAKEIAEKLSP
jgi:hypothetical protein